MTTFGKLFLGAAALGALAAPAMAQNYPYSNQGYAYPNQGYAYPNQGYAYPNQGYQQPYNNGTSVVGQVIDSLLGNRYNVTDRTAVSQCASAAMAQAAAQYRGGYNGYNNNGYNNGYGQGYNQSYNGYGNARVTAITNVERRSNGLRVSGMLDSGNRYRGGYGNQYANGYAGGTGDLTFRCNVDYRGAVTNVRVRPANGYRGY